MTAVAEKTLRELVLESPEATRALEKLGLDYCCGGTRSLEEACGPAGLSVEDVVRELKKVQSAAGRSETKNWSIAPLADLIEHIQATHHKYTQLEIARLGPLFEKVCRVHGKNHPELLVLQSTFQTLAQELAVHMMKEERVLFPYVMAMEESILQKEPVMPAHFGTVRNPIAMMEHEHDSAGRALKELRDASNGYALPGDACMSYQTLYRALEEFEADLHQHIHLENNILFPRAEQTERESR
jgi:regulator of cell morphogenesis and NO signaling